MNLSRPATGLLRVAVVAGLLVGGGAIASEPADGTSYRAGIDVSHWNGTIDWRRAFAAGKRSVFLDRFRGTGFSPILIPPD